MTLRDIDCLVAEHIMGFNVFSDGAERIYTKEPLSSKKQTTYLVSDYTTDIASAWEIVEKIKDYPFTMRKNSSGWFVYFITGHSDRGQYESRSSSGVQLTAPLAICIAALHAVGVNSEHLQVNLRE